MSAALQAPTFPPWGPQWGWFLCIIPRCTQIWREAGHLVGAHLRLGGVEAGHGEAHHGRSLLTTKCVNIYPQEPSKCFDGDINFLTLWKVLSLLQILCHLHLNSFNKEGVSVFKICTYEDHDIAIAMSSSRADPVLGLNILSYCPGWGYLNI